MALLLSMLALVVALSGSAYAVLAAGSVGTKQLAKAAVTKSKIKNQAVTSKKLAPGSVGGAAIPDGAITGAHLADGSVDRGTVLDRTLRLGDLGGGRTDQVTTTSQVLNIAAGECRSIFLRLDNPSVSGTDGSMVVGTITNGGGNPVVNNSGFVVPTLVTPTSQGGSIYHLGVCAGGSSQSIPIGSIVRWSVIAP